MKIISQCLNALLSHSPTQECKYNGSVQAMHDLVPVESKGNIIHSLDAVALADGLKSRLRTACPDVDFKMNVLAATGPLILDRQVMVDMLGILRAPHEVRQSIHNTEASITIRSLHTGN